MVKRTTRRHEAPLKRVNPGGGVRWVARYTARDGKRRSAGSFEKRGPCREPDPDGCCAQHAIWQAYDDDKATRAVKASPTVGAFFQGWLAAHPRSPRTERSYDQRVRYVLDVDIDGRPLRDWPFAELGRPEALRLVDVMLREQGRAAKGAVGVIRVLSAMAENAMDERLLPLNPFKGVRVRASDPRVRKPARRIHVWSFQEMHEFAAATGQWEPMVRLLSDCGLRLGELLPLERADVHGGLVRVERTAFEGRVEAGTKTDHGEATAGRDAPIPPELDGLLAGMPVRIDSRLLFPTQRGHLWRERNWYRDVWQLGRDGVPAMAAATPHEFRHSWVSNLRAAGVDPSDLAAMAGHAVETATRHYTHPLLRSYEAARKAVGE